MAGSADIRAVTTRAKAKRPSAAQSRYLKRGLAQPGGKLPLFDVNGQRIKAQTIRSCMEKGWCEGWARNPIKPDWIVCKLTDAGRNAVTKTIKRPQKTEKPKDGQSI